MKLFRGLYHWLIRHPAWFWSTDAGLSALLFSLTLFIFILSPLSRHYNMGEALNVLFGFVLLSGVISASGSARLRWLMMGVAVPSMVLRWVASGSRQALWQGLHHGLDALFYGVIVIALIGRVFQRGPKTGHRVQGAVAVYLVQGLLWAALYQLLEAILPGSFQIPVSPDGSQSLPAAQASAFVYFSFVTLTTVGYGDVLALDPLARSLAMMEALTGQLFPAVLIARIVALQVIEEQG